MEVIEPSLKSQFFLMPSAFLMIFAPSTHIKWMCIQSWTKHACNDWEMSKVRAYKKFIREAAGIKEKFFFKGSSWAFVWIGHDIFMLQTSFI